MQKQCHLCESTTLLARGLCRLHYVRLQQRKLRNPDTWEGWPFSRIRGLQRATCDYCMRKPKARSLCDVHYALLRRRGMLDVRLASERHIDASLAEGGRPGAS